MWFVDQKCQAFLYKEKPFGSSFVTDENKVYQETTIKKLFQSSGWLFLDQRNTSRKNFENQKIVNTAKNENIKVFLARLK